MHSENNPDYQKEPAEPPPSYNLLFLNNYSKLFLIAYL